MKGFRIGLTLFIVISLILPCMPAQTVLASGESVTTFALMTDTHIGNGNDQKTSDAVGNISPVSLDFVVHLGDAIDGDSTNQTFDDQWGNLTPIMATLPQDLYYVRGNHDLVNGWTDAQNIAKWITKSGMSNNYYSFDNGSFHFVVLDLVATNATETNWLTADLAASIKPTVIFSHYPIVAFDGIVWKGGNSAYQTILENDGDVVAVFTGHLHENAHRTVNGIEYYGLSNTYTDSAYDIVTVYTNNAGSYVEVRGFGINDSYSNVTSSQIDPFFTYSRSLTVNFTTINISQTNYPVRISLNASNFNFTHVTANGSDIRFFDNDGATLPYDIEYWDNTAPEAVIWVKVPSMTANTTHNISMHYGNSNVADGQNKKDVWGTQTVLETFNGAGNVTGSAVGALATGKIGVYYVQDNVTAPSAGGTYNTTYNPPGTWNLSAPNLELVSWVASNRSTTNFNFARMYVYDTNNNSSYWNMNITGGQWGKAVWTIASGTNSTPAPNLSAIDKIVWSFNASDTVGFYVALDLLYTYSGYNDVWHLNEGTGTTVSSVTRLQDYDTWKGNLTSAGISWSANHSLAFNGTLGYVAFQERDQYDAYARGYTIDVYASQNSVIAAQFRPLVTKDNGANINIMYRFQSLAGVPRNIIHDGSNNDSVQAASAISNNNSLYMAATFDMNNMYVYKSGVAGSPTARTTVAPKNSKPLYIGSDIGQANWWSGTISEVRMINVARDAQWIKADNLNFTNTLTDYGTEHLAPAGNTLAATSVYVNSQTTLNGNLTDLGGYSTATAWWEWGYSTSYGNVAGNQTGLTTGAKSVAIANFDPLQTVHFRFVTQNPDGTTYGSDLTFKATTATDTFTGLDSVMKMTPMLMWVALIIGSGFLFWGGFKDIGVSSAILIGVGIMLLTIAVLTFPIILDGIWQIRILP